MARVNSKKPNASNKPRSGKAPTDSRAELKREQELRRAMERAAVAAKREAELAADPYVDLKRKTVGVAMGVKSQNPNETCVCALWEPVQGVERGKELYIEECTRKIVLLTGKVAENPEPGWERKPWFTAKLALTHEGMRYYFSERGGYDAEALDAVPWEVPVWAMAIIRTMVDAITRAYDIGEQDGTASGIKQGKSFVRMLAEGEVTVNDFEAEGNDALENRHRPLKTRW